MRFKWQAMGLVAALFFGSAAHATSMVGMDVPALARKSEAVVRGKVQRVESRWSGDRKRIVTEITVEVAETLKGEPPPVVTVIQPGGQVGDIGQRVDGMARFEKDEEVVLFLDKH